MISIGIFGHSGSGKSTVSKMLLELLENSTIISGDEFHKQSIFYYPDEFELIYGEKVNENNISSAFDCLRNGNRTQERTYQDIVFPFINDKLQEAIINRQKEGFDFAIVDWSQLPNVTFRELLDYFIMVDAIKGVRNNRLTNRSLLKGLKYCENRSRERYLANKDLIQNTTGVDYTIMNEDESSLKNKMVNLADKISRKEKINLLLHARCR